MAIKILMPALSPTMTDGHLAKWHKKEGDKIAPGDIIAEIETDKATMEVEATYEGVLAKILVPENTANVIVGSTIGLLLEEGDDETSLLKLEQDVVVKNVSKPAKAVLITQNVTSSTVTDEKIVNAENKKIFASPLARKIASNENINLAKISGSGPNGRIIKRDILEYKPGPDIIVNNTRNNQEYRLVPNNNVRKIIAKRLLDSKQNVPHFYLNIECNLDKLLLAREEVNNSLSKEEKISVNDMVVLAVGKALRDAPEANASWSDDAIMYYNNVDISVAVAIDGGLITPIARNADQKSLSVLSRELKVLLQKARDNKLKPEEYQGGGFSISNLGMFGITRFSAIINPPQSCILAVGAGIKKAVVIDDQVKICTMMEVTLSCDHRVVDGAVGAKFLAAFKKYIEAPLLMLV